MMTIFSSDKPHPPMLLGRRQVLSGLGAGAVGLTLAGCQINSQGLNIRGVQINTQEIIDTGVGLFKGFNIGEEDEIRMGQQLYGKTIDQMGGAYKNSAVQSAMDRFADAMFASASRKKMNWEITVIDDNLVNAWAMPGGKIAINKGLLRYVADEHELAAVLAHEIGHIENAHAVSAMRTQRFSNTLSKTSQSVISRAVKKKTGSAAIGTLSDLAIGALAPALTKLITTGYSRSHEFEADAHILKAFGASGHDPAKASNFFSTLLQLIPAGQTNTTSLYSTHPATKERIEKLRSAAQGRRASRRPRGRRAFAVLRRSFPHRRYFKRNLSSS